jgi:hypothetical protein
MTPATLAHGVDAGPGSITAHLAVLTPDELISAMRHGVLWNQQPEKMPGYLSGLSDEQALALIGRMLRWQ